MYRTEKEKHYKNRPASFVVNISSYSSRILSSRSFSSLSHIIPTCLRENKGCSFLLGDVAAEDVPVRWEINTGYWSKMEAIWHTEYCTTARFFLDDFGRCPASAWVHNNHHGSSFNTTGWKRFILHQCRCNNTRWQDVCCADCPSQNKGAY